MKRSATFIIVLTAALAGCGPAAEDREQMHIRAKAFQDSIANMIRSQMAEAEAPVNTAVQVDTAARPAPSPSNLGR